MASIDDLIIRAGRYDAELARDISDYVRGRQYGLVFEASKPEHVRLWNKPIAVGDLVNILPPRGQAEDVVNDTDPADVIYSVRTIDGDTASLIAVETQEKATARINDLVTLARFDQPIYAGLRETGRVERGGDKPYHTVINGENFHALQTLVYAYQGKVDCIYIDPPYNTGAKDWKYNNNYVGAEDVYRHSKWLTFMEDRLKLAKKLLNPNNSVLIVTIDEKEYLRLGLLLEQMFPEAVIQMISSVINPYGSQRLNEFNRVDEYIFFVMMGQSQPSAIVIEEDAKSEDVISAQGIWKTFRRGDLASRRGMSKGGKAQFYPVYVNVGTGRIELIGEPLPHNMPRENAPQIEGCYAVFPLRDDGTEMNWCVRADTANELLRNGYLKAGKFNEKTAQKYPISYLRSGTIKDIDDGKIVIDGYENDGSIRAKYVVQKGQIPATNWRYRSHSARDHGTNLLKAIFGEKRFDYPKSLYAVEDCLRIFVSDKSDALIVDFFSGSGTTAHATMLLNRLDGGHRRCISVTNNEVSDDEQKKFVVQGLRQGDPEWEKYGICEYVTKPRIKAAITGQTPDGEPIKGDYKFTDEFPMADGFEENAIFFDLEYLEPGIVAADLAFEKVAPILWMRGGCEGPILSQERGFAIGKTYAVLFNNRYVRDFINQVRANDDIQHIFVVTDLAERYRDMCAEFPTRDVVQLYESYLRSFEINTGA